MAVKKRKPALCVEHRLTKLEGETRTLFNKLSELAQSITVGLEKTSIDLKTLLDRKQSYDAVKDFLHKCFQVSVSLSALAWAICAIISAIKEWK